MKRFFDLTVVILLLPIWLPVLAAVALLVRITSGAPIFFSQKRTGFKNRPFKLYKLRTMRLGEGGDKERITALGRFLRASSLDELPELWNVLKGEMSLVGPRPLPTRYLPRYSPRQLRRHDAMPGITGWAQVNGRNALSWREKFDYDLWYVDNRGFWLDIKILLITCWQVMFPGNIDASQDETMPEFMGERQDHP